MTGRRSCSPSGRKASTAAIQNGEVATSTAVRPLGTHCSANTTPPLPSTSIRNPSSVIEPQRDGAGSDSPRITTQPASNPPASVQRSPPIRNGGMVSSEIRIPK